MSIKKALAQYVGQEKIHDIMVLMHNRMGIRIEYNLNDSEIELWISPKAGKSVDYHDRNFSNRDDHTKLFDRILLPGISKEDFVRCEYDPFYSIIYFKDRSVHILSLEDKPVVLVWCDKAQTFDFKSDKADSLVERSPEVLCVRHPDRDYVFEYAAVLAPGQGSFRHQLEVDRGRSTYARVSASEGQAIVISGGLTDENVLGRAKGLAVENIAELIRVTGDKADKACGKGRLVFDDMPELQKLVNINKKILYSVQDASGSLRAAIKRIYYLIWVRDGGITCPYQAYSGWADPIGIWDEFLLSNPTEVVSEEPKGKTFAQMVNGKITKWQEDGPFYAVWSAFTHWTQTGDRKYLSGKYMEILKESIRWLEEYCYDSEKGLFGRYFRCETPFAGSRDYGWDNAVGKPISDNDLIHEGHKVKKSYDIYVNALMYSAYMMLSAGETGEAAEEFFKKASILKKNMEPCFDGDIPSYGLVSTYEGKEMMLEPYGLDATDYIWGLCLPPFLWDIQKLQVIREKMFDIMMKKPKGQFVAGYCALMASIDTEFFCEDKVMDSILYVAKQCYRPGKYLPMPYTIVEIVDVEDGNIYHDVRPQCFSIGAFIGSVSNLAVRRLPLGIAVRATKYVKQVEKYEYKGSAIDMDYTGSGSISRIILNGSEIKYTYQIPEETIVKGVNKMEIQLAENGSEGPVLVYSTISLKSVSVAGSSVEYCIEAFGCNELVFKNTAEQPVISGCCGDRCQAQVKVVDGYTYMSFEGRGCFKVIV